MSQKIMILEDDQAVAEMMKFYLEEEDYEVIINLTGENFVEETIECQPDLITINILLPDRNGWKISQDLKINEHTRNIPFIYITGMELTDKHILEREAAGYLIKPFKEYELKNLVRSVLENENK